MYINKWLNDVGSRGQVAFNTGSIKTHGDAEKYARKTYRTVIEQEVFVGGWNEAFWDEQERVLKASRAGAKLNRSRITQEKTQ